MSPVKNGRKRSKQSQESQISQQTDYHGGSNSNSEPILGALYEERVKSFVNNDWPFADPTMHTCTAEELSMAGFMWCANKEPDDEPFGKCFACDVEVIVHDFGPETDPWYLHQERSPTCPYIKLGKRKFPQDYKMREIYDIVIQRRPLRRGLMLSEIENVVKSLILNLDGEQDVDK